MNEKTIQVVDVKLDATKKAMNVVTYTTMNDVTWTALDHVSWFVAYNSMFSSHHATSDSISHYATYDSTVNFIKSL